MTYPQPLTCAAWRRSKSATRHQRFLERFYQAQDEYKAWLEVRQALRRDEATDPHRRDAQAVEATA